MAKQDFALTTYIQNYILEWELYALHSESEKNSENYKWCCLFCLLILPMWLKVAKFNFPISQMHSYAQRSHNSKSKAYECVCVCMLSQGIKALFCTYAALIVCLLFVLLCVCFSVCVSLCINKQKSALCCCISLPNFDLNGIKAKLFFWNIAHYFIFDISYIGNQRLAMSFDICRYIL